MKGETIRVYQAELRMTARGTKVSRLEIFGDTHLKEWRSYAVCHEGEFKIISDAEVGRYRLMCSGVAGYPKHYKTLAGALKGKKMLGRLAGARSVIVDLVTRREVGNEDGK